MFFVKIDFFYINMKIITGIFLMLITFLFGIIDCVAKNNLPAPNPNGKTNNGFPPPPPGLPIDEGVCLLFIVGLLYGIYFIYKYQLKNKNSL
jgi:hypothetical protein